MRLFFQSIKANQYLEIAIKQLKLGDNSIENLEVEDQTIITKKFIREASNKHINKLK